MAPLWSRNAGRRPMARPPHPAWAKVRRGIRRGMVLALVAGMVVATGGGTLWLGRTLLHLGPLQVHGIEINGTERTPKDALLAQAGLALHQPLLGINLGQSVRAIEALPWVREATVRRQLPDRLRIEVIEHTGKAAAMLGDLWLVNPDGEPFKRFSSTDRLVLPVITGVRAAPTGELPLAAQPKVTCRLRQGLALLDAMVAVRDDLFNVDELHWDADLGWSSIVLLGRAHARSGAPRPTTLVHLGRDPESRLGVLTHVLEQLADRHEVPEVIWASHAHQEGRVQVQLASLVRPLDAQVTSTLRASKGTAKAKAKAKVGKAAKVPSKTDEAPASAGTTGRAPTSAGQAWPH